MISDDEVDNYIMQLTMARRRGRYDNVNVHDFHQSITYDVPTENEEKKVALNDSKGWWEYIKMQTLSFEPCLNLKILSVNLCNKLPKTIVSSSSFSF